MLHRVGHAVNRALPVLLLAGCVAPEDAPAPLLPVDGGAARLYARGGGPANGLADLTRRVGLPLGGRLADLPERDEPAPPPGETGRPVLDEVGAAQLTDARSDESLGEALAEHMATFSDRKVEQYGVALLTPEEAFGTTGADGLCEQPEILWRFDEGGTSYEADLVVMTYTAVLGDVALLEVDVTNGCTAAIDAAGGDADAAVESGDCIEDEEQTFFPEGSACRDCLEAGGTWDACEADAACASTAPAKASMTTADGEILWYTAAYASVWACAPDWSVLTYFLVDLDDDGTIPRAFDHARWAYVCTPFWNPEIDAAAFVCVGSEDPMTRGVLADGGEGYVDYLRAEGRDDTPFQGRPYYYDRVDFRGGGSTAQFWAFNPGAGAVSAPSEYPDSNGNGEIDLGDENYGFGYGGFGLDPYTARPDGEPYAREWLGVNAMKAATMRSGVPIYVYDFSRCAESAWQDLGDGTYRCTEMGEPTFGWGNDVDTTWYDSTWTQAEAFPMATLASTGLPDPDVPGRLVVHMASSPALANPDWDDCALPHTFQPDYAPYEDVPGVFDGRASLDGQTYRFGKDDEGIQVVLHTNQARGWCPSDADGGEARSLVDLIE